MPPSPPTMDTPWGPLVVSDSHVHFFSYRFFSLLAAQLPNPSSVSGLCAQAGVDAPPEDPAEFASLWAAELDRHNVSSAALLASLPGDEDSVAAAIRAVPGRFHGFFFVNPLADGAITRAEAALDNGLSTLCLLPAMHGFSLNSAVVEPFFSLAGQRRATVFVHCGVLSVGIRKRLGLSSRFDLRYSNPIDLHPIALRHDRINFILPHFGAGYFREALMLASLCPNVYLDTSSTNAWRKFLTPPPSLDQVFERALELLGDTRLLFGTDSSVFPRGWHRAVFDEQVQCLVRLGASPSAARRIFGENILKLMNSAHIG